MDGRNKALHSFGSHLLLKYMTHWPFWSCIDIALQRFPKLILYLSFSYVCALQIWTSKLSQLWIVMFFRWISSHREGCDIMYTNRSGSRGDYGWIFICSNSISWFEFAANRDNYFEWSKDRRDNRDSIYASNIVVKKFLESDIRHTNIKGCVSQYT